MKKNPTKCSVPFEQRPLNEYLHLKQSFDFNWTITTPQNFLKNSTFLIIIIYMNCACLVFSTSTLNDTLTKKIILSLLFSTSILTMIFFRVYLGLNYIYNRLVQATVAYEESGWYDGQIWVKTTETLIQDRLIGKYELLPILTKLRTSAILFLALTLLEIYIWIFIIK